MRLACAAAFAIGSLLQALALGAQRTPVVQSVDLMVPAAPVTFKEGGRIQLAHELHITNFLPVDVSLMAVRVRGSDGRVLAEYRDQDLRRATIRPGLRSDHQTPQVVGPGMRAVVNFWFALPDGAPAPQSVLHAVELDIMRPSGAVHASVEGGAAAVSKQPAIALDPPLRGGPWIAIYDPLLKGGHRTAIYTTGGHARIPGRFAIDFIALPAAGVLPPKPTSPPDDWNGFGSEVLAVADGGVAAAMDDTPDHTPPPIAPEVASGNYVAIDLGGGRFAFYEHLKRGSVVVKAGDRVRRGQVVGRLGASGSSSMGPHLHFHVADANSTLGAEGMPFVFKRFDHLGAFASIDALIKGEKWSAAPANRESQRTLERPEANSVVRFP